MYNQNIGVSSSRGSVLVTHQRKISPEAVKSKRQQKIKAKMTVLIKHEAAKIGYR